MPGSGLGWCCPHGQCSAMSVLCPVPDSPRNRSAPIDGNLSREQGLWVPQDKMGCRAPSLCPMWALLSRLELRSAGPQECRSSGFVSSWCRAGFHHNICCNPPGDTTGTPVLRSFLTMACSLLPRWQSYSKSHSLWGTTGPSEVTLVVFCLCPGLRVRFPPIPWRDLRLWWVLCQVPLPQAPWQWDGTLAQTHQLAQPHTFFSGHVLAPHSAHPLPCLIFKEILFSEIPPAVPSVHPDFSPSLKRFQQGPSKAKQICRRGNVNWSLQQLLKGSSARFGCFWHWCL